MKKHIPLAALSLAALFALAGCPSNTNNMDDGSVLVLPEAGPDTRPPADTNTTDATAPEASAMETGAPETGAPEGGTDGGYVDGCYVGTPRVMADWLNRCTTAVAFPPRAARGARLLPDGGVASLP